MSFESSFDAASAGMMAAVMGIFMVIWLVAIAFSVVSYVLSSRGMQVIARRRGIRKSWLAWVPVANKIAHQQHLIVGISHVVC